MRSQTPTTISGGSHKRQQLYCPLERMKTPTTASCFATYTLPYVLFVDDFQERRRIALTCCLAWNISLFQDARQREEHIAMTWNMGVDDNRPLPPPAGMEHGWKSEMRMLIAKKQDLFPYLLRTIRKVELLEQKPHDVLRVQTDDDSHEIPLVTHPRVEGLPLIIPVLKRMREDTEKQIETLRQIAEIPGGLSEILEPRMAMAYCSQRADLLGYHRMLTEWQETQTHPVIKRGLGQWLAVLDEIEAHTKTVLGIIIPAINGM
jgi:hypothetical protein